MYKEHILDLKTHKEAGAIIYDYSMKSHGILELLNALKTEKDLHYIQKAFWVIYAYFKLEKPSIEIQEKLFELIGLNPTLQRNVVKIWQHFEFDESLDAQIVEHCLNFIQTPGEAIAVKAFSMAKLTNLAEKYPALAPEVLYAIQDLLAVQHSDPGIFNRGTKSILRLKNLLRG